ncbi:hypothetical protein [Enterococcus wangshanyuanii]|uniref:hypothetical protein n=1 Tax=Enterococcus wangshanyuanii TaxID=2005703 RepID=UPI001E3EDD19|nr:hypothetical protein [Enterococcus wangshanyuanii]
MSLEILKAQYEELEKLKEEEEDYFENIPDNLQGSTNYEKSEDAISEFEDSLNSLDDVIETLKEVVS